MNKSLCFVYFDVVHTGVYSCNHQQDLVFLANYMKQFDIHCEFFLSEQLESLVEFVDEIGFMDGDTVVLLLDQANSSMVPPVAREIASSLEFKNVIVLDQTRNCRSETENLTVLPYDGSTGDVKRFLQELDVQAEPVPSTEQVFNCYSSGLLPLSETKTVGLNLDAFRFMEQKNQKQSALQELRYIQEHTTKGQTVRLNSQDLIAYDGQPSFFAELRAACPGLQFKGRIDGQSLTPEGVELLLRSGFTELTLLVSSLGGLQQASRIFLSRPYDLNLRMVLELDQLPVAESAVLLQQWFDKKLLNMATLSCLGDYELERQLHAELSIPVSFGRYQALLRGVDLYFTGMYEDMIATGNIKHLAVTDPDALTVENFARLKNFVSLNHALYLFLEDDQAEIPSLQEIQAIAAQADYPLNNLLVFKAQPHGYRLTVNDQPLISVWVRDYAQITVADYAAQDDKYFARMGSQSDLDAFLRDVELYNRQGKLRNELIDFQLINMCRWVGFNSCHLHKMPRALLRDGEFIFCETDSSAFGSVEQMQFETVQQIYVAKDRAESQRNCVQCEQGEHCSKCAVLPEFLAQDAYCDLRRSNNYISTFLYNSRFMRLILDVSQVFRGRLVEEFRFFSPNCDLDCVADLKGETSYLMPGVQAFCDEQNYYLFSPSTNGIMALNQNLYLILQLMIKQLSPGEIAEVLSREFNITENAAAESFKNAMELLKKKGCIKEMILA